MSAENKTHDALLSHWKENARNHDEENYWFLRSLKQKSGKKVDRIALELHQEAFRLVDCTRCANCCRTLDGAAGEVHHVQIQDAKLHYHQRTDEFYYVIDGEGS